MSTTNIEWTDRVWNPITGCTKVSPGCKHCYAEGVAHRFWHHQYVHTADRGFIPVTSYAGDQMTGRLRKFTDVMTHTDRLHEPLSWRRPAKVFVNSMSDLFHEDVPDAFIDKVFAVMFLAHRHTFQVLTKRPKRMAAYLGHHNRAGWVQHTAHNLDAKHGNSRDEIADWYFAHPMEWPLPNVWLGVSVEDQQRADERIPLLLQTPSAVRFISAEPLLGPVELSRWFGGASSRVSGDNHGPTPSCSQQGADTPGHGVSQEVGNVANPQSRPGQDPCAETRSSNLHLIIVGGESGPGARPCDIEWIRSIVRQCQASGTAVFVKQLGANPIWRLGNGMQFNSGSNPEESRRGSGMLDRKGGDPSEWPEDLRVREFPR